MLRKSLIALALLAASTGVMADHDDHIYGRVVTAEPHFVLSFGGSRHQDGFRILYEVGGNHYWTHSPRRPGPVIWVPRPVSYYAYQQRHHDWDRRRGDWRDDHGRWDRHDRDNRYGHHGGH